MTLKEFKQEILVNAKVTSPDAFCRISKEHADYWQELNRIGLEKVDPENPPKDPDAEVMLTEAQRSVLRISYTRLSLFGRK